MFQKVKNYFCKVKEFFVNIKECLVKVKEFVTSPRFVMAMLIMACCTAVTYAQNAAGDYSAGTTALGTVAEELVKYVPAATKVCYALAGVVAILGAISVYIAMNNEEQDIKKKIMMTVGACIFLIAAAQALPMFFGITNG